MTRTWGSAALALLLLASSSWAQEEGPQPGPAPADSSELLERIRKLEEQVRALREGQPAAPPAAPAPAAPAGEGEFRHEPDPEPEWRLDPADAPPPPHKKASYEKVKDWPHPYGFVDDGKHPVLELPKDMKLRFWGEVRARAEYRDPADYRIPGQAGRPATDDPTDATDLTLLRTRIGLDFKIHRHLRAVIDLQDSRVWGDTAPGSDTAEVYVRQAFAEIMEPLDAPVWIWVGRWDVPELGDGRLISPLHFANVTRSWDGVQAFAHFGGTDADPWAWFTAFSANVREGALFGADRDENDDFWFSGAYLSLRGWKKHEIDFYVFHRHFSDRAFTSEVRTGLGKREDYTLGFRSAHDYGFAGYTTEIAWQLGAQHRDRVRAWAGAARGWFRFDLGEERQLEVAGEYAYASGDRKPADGKSQNFDPLVPRNFLHHGNMNLVAWSNIHDLSGEVNYTVFKGLILRTELHGFWLDKQKDGWFAQPHTLVRRDPTGRADSFLGTELDLTVEWTLFDDHLRLRASYSHFWAGGYVRDTGRAVPSRSSGGMDFAFFEVRLTF